MDYKGLYNKDNIDYTKGFEFFYGAFSFLSNHYRVNFSDKLKNKYTSVEQYFMCHKAILFKDRDMANKILNENNPVKCKKLGREVKDFNEEVWQKNRLQIMFEGLCYKFLQNDNICQKLIYTGNKIIVESSYDCYYGNGLSLYDIDRFDVNKWKGESKLGFLLMEVRDLVKEF